MDKTIAETMAPSDLGVAVGEQVRESAFAIVEHSKDAQCCNGSA